MVSLNAIIAALAAASLGLAGADDRPPHVLMLDFMSAVQDERYEDVLAQGAVLTEHPVFAQLPGEGRAMIAAEMGAAHYFRREMDQAELYFIQARTLYPAIHSVSYYLITMYAYSYRSDEASDLFLGIAPNDTSLNDLRPNILMAIAGGLRRNGDMARLDAFLEGVLRRYQPPEGPSGHDWARQMVIERHAEMGRIDEAMQEARNLVGASALMNLRAERRFEELWTWSGFDRITDVRRGMERETQTLRDQLAGRNPALRAAAQLSANLLHLGDIDGAEETARAWLARVEAGERFGDAWEYHALLHVRLADVKRARGDEAGAEARFWRAVETALASDHPEMAGPYLLDIARQQALTGRAREALETLEQVQEDFLTSRGRSITTYIRTLAAHQLGDSSGAEALMADMRENSGLNHLRVLLFTGQMEAAEAALREQVSTPSGAEDILAMLHAYRTHERAVQPALQLEARARLLELAGRPGIAEAIAEAGRILSIDDLYELDLEP
ncbi:hypothetical protein F1654_10545 [Alkalicaulis satelles]|uniref:Tetratricopeptide repeat protein n=1 Tax=Alkalicaulis satelles TaxID=2609175 RepID=A0A5M6ZC15_9PROT|nr:hypothetical protein [Alkalicaulis satelles]KAA5802263.1 hypothetical protein F1654_10545 [Alkalicaulis satelles]